MLNIFKLRLELHIKSVVLSDEVTFFEIFNNARLACLKIGLNSYYSLNRDRLHCPILIITKYDLIYIYKHFCNQIIKHFFNLLEPSNQCTSDIWNFEQNKFLSF